MSTVAAGVLPARRTATTRLPGVAGTSVVEQAPEPPADADAPPEAVADRATQRWVVAATVVGAVWRIGVLISKWSQGLLFNDSLYYSFQAHSNAHGNWFRLVFTNGPGAEHPPLASLLMTPASMLPHAVFWQRATSTVLGIAVIPLLGLLGLRLGGRRVAILAACIAAVYPNLWMNDALVMSESTASLLMVVVLLCAWRLHQRFDRRSAMLLGAVIGLAVLARSELILLAPLFGFIGWRNHDHRKWIKRASLVLVSTGMVVLPWMVYNLTRFEQPVLLSTNDGGVLLGSNCDQTYSGAQIGGWLTGCFDGFVSLPGEDPSQLSRRERSAALHYISNHAGRVPLVVAARLLRTADLYGLPDLVRMDVADERARWASWSGIVCWWLLAPFALVGLWRSRRTVGWLLCPPLLAGVLTAALFYGAHRLRSPMEPVVVVCAAIGIVSCVGVGRSRAAA
ncbi:MAG: hypothetical protein F2789_10625 [Actinobacteria bacterium]|nr:hypothetical protein [Actinomycetota bacterium]